MIDKEFLNYHVVVDNNEKAQLELNNHVWNRRCMNEVHSLFHNKHGDQ
jgi:hypothetical protein